MIYDHVMLGNLIRLVFSQQNKLNEQLTYQFAVSVY